MTGKRPPLSQSSAIPPLCDTWLSAKKHKKTVNRPAQNMQVKVKHLWWPAIKPAAVTKQASLLEYFLPGAKRASDNNCESTVDGENLNSTESHQTSATDDNSSIVDDPHLATVASHSTSFECEKVDETDGDLQSDDDVDHRCADDRTRCDPLNGGSINADGSVADAFESQYVSKPSCGSVIDSANEVTHKNNERPTSSTASCTWSSFSQRHGRLFSRASGFDPLSAEIVLVPDSLQQVADCHEARFVARSQSQSSLCVPSSFVEDSVSAALSACSSGSSSDADGADVSVDDDEFRRLKGCSKRWTQGRGVSRPESDSCYSRKQTESKPTNSSICRRVDSELSRSRAVNTATEKHERGGPILQSEFAGVQLEPIADNSDLSFCEAGEFSYDMILGNYSDVKLTDTQKVNLFEMELELMNERRSSQADIDTELALDTCSQFF